MWCCLQTQLQTICKQIINLFRVTAPGRQSAWLAGKQSCIMFCCDGLIPSRNILLQKYNIYDMQKYVMHGMDRVHGWLASRVAMCFDVTGL